MWEKLKEQIEGGMEIEKEQKCTQISNKTKHYSTFLQDSIWLLRIESWECIQACIPTKLFGSKL
jgi:hypothetical protein